MNEALHAFVMGAKRSGGVMQLPSCCRKRTERKRPAMVVHGLLTDNETGALTVALMLECD